MAASNHEHETRRKFERANLDVYVNKIIGDQPHMARVRDISTGGLYLYKLIEPEIPEATNVGLELMLPGTNEVIWALGEVVREDKSRATDGVAVRFVRLSEHDRQLIAQYIATRDQNSKLVSAQAA